jgi:hypothetical protein
MSEIGIAESELNLVPKGDMEQDATPSRLFYSPVKNITLVGGCQAIETVDYPELPQSLEVEAKLLEDTEQEQQASPLLEAFNADDVRDDIVVAQPYNDKVEALLTTEEGSKSHQTQLTYETTSTGMAEISYPSLPSEGSIGEPIEVATPPKDYIANTMVATHDALEMPPTDKENDMELDETVDSPDEEFTEASLQLDIQREMEVELQKNPPNSSEMPEEQHDSAASRTLEPGYAATAEEVTDLCQQEVLDEEDHDIVELTAESKSQADDIAAGLTLDFSMPLSKEPTPRKLRSSSPPPNEQGADDATMTVALDDDTAILKDFLSRAAASKANRTTNTARRESLHNRRDSDAIRNALASPRKVLEDKDPNSPSKYDNEITLDLSQTLTLTPDLPALASPSEEQVDNEDAEDSTSSRSRRSSRTRISRLPAPSSIQPAGLPKIAVRRADGGEPIVLKKSDAQELSLVTRANTRKNKQGSVTVNIRLLKLAMDAMTRSDDNIAQAVPVPGKKYVRWDQQLAYYQEGTDTMANMLADAESLATADELSLPSPSSNLIAKSKLKVPKDKTSTPKMRRVRGLGTTNGTPGKGLLQPGSLFPECIQEEHEATHKQTQPQRLPKPKSSKLKKTPIVSTTTLAPTSSMTPTPSTQLDSRVPILDVAPVGVEHTNPSTSASASTTFITKERKSRLATPRKVKLPQPLSRVAVEGKENAQRTGLAAGTPKKGIPISSGIVAPSVGVETGLPRRRARKV